MDGFTGGSGLVERVCAVVGVMEKLRRKVESKEGNTSKAGGVAKGKREEKRDVFLEECRHPLLIPFLMISSHNSLCKSPSHTRGSCSQTPACSHLLPTSIPVRQHQHLELCLQSPAKPLKSVGHSREASHCFPVIRLVKVPPGRGKA